MMRNGLSLVVGAVLGFALAAVVAFGAVALTDNSAPSSVPQNDIEYQERIGNNVPKPPNYGS